ncbi:hypothetical protein Lal_00047884 [Lupinus albus]|nr:hypothetical protein Lal_00047884 [Lupinus albus]
MKVITAARWKICILITHVQRRLIIIQSFIICKTNLNTHTIPLSNQRKGWVETPYAGYQNIISSSVKS